MIISFGAESERLHVIFPSEPGYLGARDVDEGITVSRANGAVACSDRLAVQRRGDDGIGDLAALTGCVVCDTV
jgi:hypothetical protein